MNSKSKFNPQSYAVVGAGPVGCIVAAYLARGGHDVILCDVISDLLKPAMDPGRHADRPIYQPPPLSILGTTP